MILAIYWALIRIRTNLYGGTRVISAQTKLSLRVIGGQPGPFYAAEVLGPGRWGLVLSVPHLLGRPAPFPAGTELLCQFQEGPRLLEFRTVVVGYEQRTPPGMVVQEPTSLVEKNRRDALRFDVELPVTYVVNGDHVTFQKTKTVDLSHTGLLLWATRPLPMGATLSLVLDLPGYTLKTDSVVRRNIPRGLRAMTGVEFATLRSGDAYQLHRYLVSLELERAKQGIAAGRQI